MEFKIQKKLISTINQFVGTTLKFGRFEERKIKDKTLLVLKLTFSDEGLYKEMILVLDKELTEGDYKEIGEKLTK